MGRTAAELREELRNNSPSWFWAPGDDAEAFLQAMAAVWESVEAAIETLHDRTFITDADGSWLDEHGRERNVQRREGESDDDYRERIRAFADLVTPNSVIAAVNRVLEIPECRLEEYLPDGFFLDDDFLDDAVLYDGLRGFTIYIPQQIRAQSDAFLGGTTLIENPAVSFSEFLGAESAVAGPGEIFLDADQPPSGPIYDKVLAEIERTHAAGVPFRVVVEESA